MRWTESWSVGSVGFVSLALCVGTIAGCGGSEPTRGPTGSVAGKVTLNGKPLPAGCTIVFTHQEKAIAVTAPVGSDGTFSLPKVLEGTHKVSFNAPTAAAAAPPDPSNAEAYKAYMMGQKQFSAGAETKGGIPKRYLTPEESGLIFTVQKGANTYEVDLKD